MDIIIRNSDSRPIYEQIGAQIRRAILSGELAHGVMLPSMRALARDLRVSLITTKRAYEDLQRDGFVEMVPGKGCFVSARNVDFIREEYLRRAEQHLAKALEQAKQGGLSAAELQEMLQELSKGD